MSSQFQLENSPELIFISIGRCQLHDFQGTPPGFRFGMSLLLRSLSSREVVWTGNLQAGCLPSGQNLLQAEQKCLCPQIRDFSRQCRTLRLPQERAKVPKSEIYFPRKCSTVRLLEKRPRKIFFLGNVVFERVWGGLYGPMVCQLDNSIFGNLLTVRSQLKCSFELVFKICHLIFNLKLFWN